ncbi:MAG: hypothetical protein FD166_1686 [Bacteroidetes bacterium]|nr:MAG: hypothetical protein FD166_1686 [Bacteroidota bacterium]
MAFADHNFSTNQNFRTFSFCTGILAFMVFLFINTPVSKEPGQNNLFGSDTNINNGVLDISLTEFQTVYRIPQKIFGQGNTTEGCHISNTLIEINVKDPEPNKFRACAQWDVNLGQVRMPPFFGFDNRYSADFFYSLPDIITNSSPLRL